MSKWGSSCKSHGELGDKRKVLCCASPSPPAISPVHLLNILIFFTSGLVFFFTIAWILHGGQAGGWGGVCTESIQGVVIFAFHFAVQLERSHFQIHPHTSTAREENTGEGGSYSRGMGQHGKGWGHGMGTENLGKSDWEWSIAFMRGQEIPLLCISRPRRCLAAL